MLLSRRIVDKTWMPLCATFLALAVVVVSGSTVVAQTVVSPDELAAVRTAYYEQHRPAADTPMPVRASAVFLEAATPTNAVLRSPGGGRSSVDLYNGLSAGGSYWYYIPGPYCALDDGTMGPTAVAVGGGQVDAYEFAFGLTADFAGDTLQPVVFISLWNAPLDPVAGAGDPVVDPFSPVSSVVVTFSPITLPTAGNYVLTSGLLDLAAAGLEFNLDETFYVEIVPLKMHAGVPVPDPNVFAVFSSGPIIMGTNQDNMWSDLFVYNPTFTWGDGDGYYDHPAELDWGGGPSYLDQSPIHLVGEECPGATLELSINEPDDVCVKPGEPVTVTLSQSCLPGLVRGYQAFLFFDTGCLAFDSGSYILPDPYGLPVVTPIAAVGGDLDLAAGIDDPSGQPLTSSTADLVTLNFTAGTTEGLTQVMFRAHQPPTRFSDEFGIEVLPITLVDSPTICIDGTPPTITCPPDMTPQCIGDVPLPAADLAEFTARGGSATDAGCGGWVVVTHEGDDITSGTGCPGNPYVVERTYRATDCAGNFAECVQTITVIDDTPPTLSECPTDVTVECDSVPTAPIVTAADNCDTDVPVVYSEVRTDGACEDNYTLTRTWTAVDDCLNETVCTQIITVQDTTPPVFTYCPPDVSVECVADAAPGCAYGVATGGIAVCYNNNGIGEIPANQAYFKAQFGGACLSTGAAYVFDDSPLTGASPFSWQDLYSGLPWPQSQFGLDLVLPAPTWDGITPIPPLFAVDYDGVGPSNPQTVLWAINDYKPHTPDITAGIIHNSVVRGHTPIDPNDVQFTRHYWTKSGTIYTAVFDAKLVSDGIHHWYTPSPPGPPHAPMSNFGLNGDFYFSGMLTYDSSADPYPLMDFYAGSLTMVANHPSAATGIPLAVDNCTLVPAIMYADTDNGGSGCPGNPLIITRTWTATDNCGNAETCVQTITVEDTTAPVISALAVTADEYVDGNCESVVSFSATVTDNCCLDAAGVTVVVTATNATVAFDPVTDLTITQVTSKWVAITGTALISDLTSCPGAVQVTIDAIDCCLNPAIQAVQTAAVDDVTDPVIHDCPSNIVVNADAGGCTAQVWWTEPTATDNCTVASFTSTHSPGEVLPQGLTTVTYTAVDQCGNDTTCSFCVTVSAYNELVVDVELSPTIANVVDRCITFELWECGTPSSEVVEAVLTFTPNGGGVGQASATIEVPCGDYSCITARDELHTLRSTVELVDAGTYYTAGFTGARADEPFPGIGHRLVGGNLNDDFWIDILDFGVFSSQWSTNYGSGDTTCATAFPHADISGDGLVSTADFTFIQVNFWLGHEANCCGQSDFTGGGPLTEISIEELRERGLGHLSVGDLNEDGWLDMEDVAAFLQGVRPQPPLQEAAEVQARPLIEAQEAGAAPSVMEGHP